MKKALHRGYVWADKWRLLGYLTPTRVINMLVLRSSYLLSAWLKSPVHRGQPFALSVEPTTACNLACPQCPSGLRSFSRKTGNLRAENFKKWLDPVSTRLTWLTFYFQGEPFINNDLMEMIRYAHDRKLYTMTSTNGHFLSKKNCESVVNSGLDRLIISVDGFTQETYRQYRVGGNLQTVIDGIKTLVHTREKSGAKNPLIVLQTIAFKHNQHELRQARAFAQKTGVDLLQVKTAQVYNESDAEQWLPDNHQLRRYRSEEGHTLQTPQLPNRCWRMWSSAVATQDGQVVPCCFDKDADHTLGMLHKNTLPEIWQSAGYQRFRKEVLTDRQQHEICRNCSEGVKVWL